MPSRNPMTNQNRIDVIIKGYPIGFNPNNNNNLKAGSNITNPNAKPKKELKFTKIIIS